MSRTDHLRKLIIHLTRRLQTLEERKALQGLETPPGVLLQIEDIKAEIAESKVDLAQIEEATAPMQSSDNGHTKSPLASKANAETAATQSTNIFICYKRLITPDQQLAVYLHQFLATQGYNVFIDLELQPGQTWLEEIDHQIKASDFLIVLLSEQSATSEMVQAEVRRAYEYRKLQGHPHILPVRMAYEGLLPYSIDALLDPLQYVIWQNEAGNERVGDDILAAIAGRLPQQSPIRVEPVGEERLISEDGWLVPDENSLHPPLPAYDPRFLEELEAPGGTVKLRDKLYIEREADDHLKRQIVKTGTLTTIRASRQKGKSSLLVRGVHHARQNGAKAISLDLQRVDSDYLETPAHFLRYLAKFIVRKLWLNVDTVDKIWEGARGPQEKLTQLLEDYVLPASDTPIVLALDEADSLLQTSYHQDFFALVRSWHNSAADDEQWEKLNLVLVISTEPYLLIPEISHSPFNAGLKLYLEDFNEAQVRNLNRRHGSPVQGDDFLEMMNLLNGHPYLTRKALYTLVAERLTWTDLIHVAAEEEGPFGDHLRRQHWLLRDEVALKTALKQIIHHQPCHDELSLFRLLPRRIDSKKRRGYLFVPLRPVHHLL